MNTVIWDFNGTLLDDFALCLRTINQMLARRDLPQLTEQAYLSVFDFPVQEYYRQAGFDFAAEPFTVLADEYMSLYLPASFSCPLRRDAQAVLADLRSRGIRQILLSASQREVLLAQAGHFGITGFFSEIIGLDDILGRSKLDLARGWFASQSIQPDDTLLVGDTTHDFVVASALQCSCALVCGGHNSRERLERTGASVLAGLADIGPLLTAKRRS